MKDLIKAIVYKALFDWKFYPEMRDEIGFKPMDHLTKSKIKKNKLKRRKNYGSFAI